MPKKKMGKSSQKYKKNDKKQNSKTTNTKNNGNEIIKNQNQNVSYKQIEGMELFYTSDRGEWRQYLMDHFETSKEIWFVFPMKESGEKSLPYNDAVEEALCFGWIDSTIKPIDKRHRAQRFTPRRKGSSYSQPNIERLIWLEEHGLIHPKIRESVLPIIRAPFVFPKDIIDILQQDEIVWKNYQQFSESYRRIRVAYIHAAKNRPEEYQKRLDNFIKKTRSNKLIKGYGGVEKYYK